MYLNSAVLFVFSLKTPQAKSIISILRPLSITWMKTEWSSFCHRQMHCSAYRQPSVNWEVQLYFDETSYRLMFEALRQVIKAKGTIVWQNYGRFFMATKRRNFQFWLHPFPLAKQYAGGSSKQSDACQRCCYSPRSARNR